MRWSEQQERVVQQQLSSGEEVREEKVTSAVAGSASGQCMVKATDAMSLELLQLRAVIRGAGRSVGAVMELGVRRKV